MNMLPNGYKLVLASKSPRRKELLSNMHIPFTIRTKSVEEVYPRSLQGAAIAEYLAELKAKAFTKELAKNELVLTSDTVVWSNKTSLAKASNKTEAKTMLQALSGTTHQVITGVCLHATHKTTTFSDSTSVTFKTLTQQEIDFYVNNFLPFDKAGAYGIQEWIGMIGIERIEGSYFTVMGLPTHLVYKHLMHF